MTYVSALAVFFILWWTVLFAILPFSLRTQDDDGDVTLGTTSSAPRGSHMRRAAWRTTLVSVAIFSLLVLLTRYFGLEFDDIPRVVPEFR